MDSIGRGLAVLALWLPLVGNAHQEDSAPEPDFAFMDCEHPPADALKKLPEPLSRWARIVCLPSGQILSQSADVQWRYPGSWVDKVLLPARTGADEQDSRPRYFTHIDVRELPAGEARTRHQQLMKRVTVYADRIADVNTNQVPDAPKLAWEIVSTNNQKNAFQIYLMQHEGKPEIWGLVCAPECEAHMSFIVTPFD